MTIDGLELLNFNPDGKKFLQLRIPIQGVWLESKDREPYSFVRAFVFIRLVELGLGAPGHANDSDAPVAGG